MKGILLSYFKSYWNNINIEKTCGCKRFYFSNFFLKRNKYSNERNLGKKERPNVSPIAI
jgi:hypothetical protein